MEQSKYYERVGDSLYGAKAERAYRAAQNHLPTEDYLVNCKRIQGKIIRSLEEQLNSDYQDNNVRFHALLAAVKASSARSAWARGVREYAVELMENISSNEEYLRDEKTLQRGLLCGAISWEAYSEGGSALIFDEDIAHRLCNKTELKAARKNQFSRPNPYENWVGCQARALRQAYNLIRRCWMNQQTEE